MFYEINFLMWYHILGGINERTIFYSSFNTTTHLTLKHTCTTFKTRQHAPPIKTSGIVIIFNYKITRTNINHEV